MYIKVRLSIAKKNISESEIQRQSEMSYYIVFHEYSCLIKWSALKNSIQKISLQQYNWYELILQLYIS